MTEILKELDELMLKLKNTRAYFPFIPASLKGESEIKTGEFYAKSGFPVLIKFDKPLTGEQIEKNNELGHFINQNFVVRLYAMLETYLQLKDKDITKKLDQYSRGYHEIIILKRLRNVFAHEAGGNYDPTNKEYDHVGLAKMMDEHLHVGLPTDNHFILSIDAVLVQLFNESRAYVELTLSPTPSPCSSKTLG